MNRLRKIYKKEETWECMEEVQNNLATQNVNTLTKKKKERIKSDDENSMRID